MRTFIASFLKLALCLICLSAKGQYTLTVKSNGLIVAPVTPSQFGAANGFGTGGGGVSNVLVTNLTGSVSGLAAAISGATLALTQTNNTNSGGGSTNSGTNYVSTFPTSISNLVRWYQGTSVITNNGAPITNWPDSSTNAVPMVGTAFYSAGGAGQPSVYFDGVSTFMTNLSGITNGTNFTIFVASVNPFENSNSPSPVLCAGYAVLSVSQWSGGFYLLPCIGQDASGVGPQIYSEFNTLTNLTGSSQAISGGSPLNIFAVEYDGNNPMCYINGVPGTAFNTGTTTPQPCGGFVVGANGVGSQYFKGFVPEIIIYNRALTLTERERVTVYLMKKYGKSGNHLTIDGDSISLGFRAGSGSGLTPLFKNTYGIPCVENAAQDGRHSADQLAALTNWQDYAFYDGRNDVHYMIGVNDINGGDSNSVTLLNVSNYARIQHFYGRKVYICTIPSFAGESSGAICSRTNLNALYKSAATNWDGIIDYAALPSIGTNGAYVPLTAIGWLAGDSTHWTAPMYSYAFSNVDVPFFSSLYFAPPINTNIITNNYTGQFFVNGLYPTNFIVYDADNSGNFVLSASQGSGGLTVFTNLGVAGVESLGGSGGGVQGLLTVFDASSVPQGWYGIGATNNKGFYAQDNIGIGFNNFTDAGITLTNNGTNVYSLGTNQIKFWGLITGNGGGLTNLAFQSVASNIFQFGSTILSNLVSQTLQVLNAGGFTNQNIAVSANSGLSLTGNANGTATFAFTNLPPGSGGTGNNFTNESPYGLWTPGGTNAPAGFVLTATDSSGHAAFAAAAAGGSGVATLNGNETNISSWNANGGANTNNSLLTTNVGNQTNVYSTWTNYAGPTGTTNIMQGTTNIIGTNGHAIIINATGTNDESGTNLVITVNGTKVINIAANTFQAGALFMTLTGVTSYGANDIVSAVGAGGNAVKDSAISLANPVFPNTLFTGQSTNQALPPVGSSNNFYATVGTGWTNGPGRAMFHIPVTYTTSVGTGATATCYVTNYSGVVGAAGVVTNVVAIPQSVSGLTGLSEGGTWYFSGWVYSNSMVNIIATAGTVTAQNNTNGYSFIDPQ